MLTFDEVLLYLSLVSISREWSFAVVKPGFHTDVSGLSRSILNLKFRQKL